MKKKRQLKTSKIIQHRYDNPYDTLEQIGENFSVSRQYIFKVLNQNGVPTIRAKRSKDTHCLYCKEISKTKIHKGKCRFNYYNVKVNCATCHVPFYRKRGQIIQKYREGYNKIYCSTTCYYKGRREVDKS